MLGTPTSELMNFLNIVEHKRMHVNGLNYNSSPYVLVIMWEYRQTTDIPLNQVMHDSPEECMKYVMKNGLNITKDSYD